MRDDKAMAIYQLNEKLWFPDPANANMGGLLAFGGDLSPERILLAYRMGIFPWFSSSEPILWWSPDPRMILFPGDLHISKSLKRSVKSKKFSATVDTHFSEVITHCAAVPRKRDTGTWITHEMIEAYCTLHKQGYAHSVEVFFEGDLAGGLYGISLGKAFFGESMFGLKTDASKVALVALVRLARHWKFDFIDCQLPTDHLQEMGAKVVRRGRFLSLLAQTIRRPARTGKWNKDAEVCINPPLPSLPQPDE